MNAGENWAEQKSNQLRSVSGNVRQLYCNVTEKSASGSEKEMVYILISSQYIVDNYAFVFIIDCSL